MTAPRLAGGLTGVLVGGFAAGVFDILYAFVLGARRGASPLRVLQSVASGLLVLVQGFVSHALLVGIPIALAIRRFSLPPGR